jgi:hypothetical protein
MPTIINKKMKNNKDNNCFYEFFGTIYDLNKIAAISECKPYTTLNDSVVSNFNFYNLEFGCDITYISPFPKIISFSIPIAEFYNSRGELEIAGQLFYSSKNFHTEDSLKVEYDYMSKHYRYNKNIHDYTFEKYLEEHGGLEIMKRTLKDIESYKELTECLNKGKLSSWNIMKEEVNNFIQKWKECNTNHVD